MFTVPLNEIWVVWATCGRSNGAAYIRAKTKEDANKFAQEGGWLDNGRVVKSETKLMMDWYKDLEGISDPAELMVNNTISEDEVAEINMLTEDGKWYEMLWGT